MWVRALVPIILLAAQPPHRNHVPPGDPVALLRRSAERLGGLERLRSLGAIRVTEEGQDYMISTPIAALAPRRPIAISQTEIRDRSGLLWHRRARTMMRPEQSQVTTLATPAAGATLSPSGWRPAPYYGWEAAMTELELGPERILLTAMDAASLKSEADTVIDGRRAHSVSFEYRRGRVRLDIDARSDFPLRVVLTRSYPADPFQTMLGNVVQATVWSNWALEGGSLWYPRLRSVTTNGERFRELAVVEWAELPAVPADSLALPDSVVRGFSVVPPAPADPAALSPRLLGQDLVLYAGGYQSAAARQSDGVIIIEAPESNRRSAAVLADVARRWPGARIKAVIVTSPMWMHLGGVREYVARGIPLYATPGVAPVITKLLAARYTDPADSLARRPRAARLTVVAGPIRLGRGAEAVAITPAPGPHGQSMLLVHWPAQRLLYGSDVLVPDRFEPTFAAAYRAEFVRSVRDLRLAVDTIFALHVPPMAMKEVEAGAPVPVAVRP